MSSPKLGTTPLQQVTILDNGTGDDNSTTGEIEYSTLGLTPDPFSDFSIDSYHADSNRTASPAPAFSDVLQGGSINRITTTGVSETLEIQVSDYNYLYPASPMTLYNSGAVTYIDDVAGDQSSLQSFYNSTPSPSVVLNSTGAGLESESGNSPATTVSGNAPFNLSKTYEFTSTGYSSVYFDSSSAGGVTGANASLAGNVYLDNNADGVLDTGTPQ